MVSKFNLAEFSDLQASNNAKTMCDCSKSPFLGIAGQIRNAYDPTAGNAYFPECDAEMIGKRLPMNNRRLKEGEKNAVRFDVSPSPFLGDVKNAKNLILSLNPGFGNLNVGGWQNLTPQERKYYADIETREMELNSPGFGEVVLDSVFQKMNGTYWLDKLRKHLLAAKGYKPGSPEERIALNKFALIDFFPYHSVSAPMSMGGILPSQKWIFKCLMPTLVANADVVVIVRAEKLWRANVPSLNNNPKVFRLNSPQNATFSKGNVPSVCWNKIWSII